MTIYQINLVKITTFFLVSLHSFTVEGEHRVSAQTLLLWHKDYVVETAYTREYMNKVEVTLL